MLVLDDAELGAALRALARVLQLLQVGSTLPDLAVQRSEDVTANPQRRFSE